MNNKLVIGNVYLPAHEGTPDYADQLALSLQIDDKSFLLAKWEYTPTSYLEAMKCAAEISIQLEIPVEVHAKSIIKADQKAITGPISIKDFTPKILDDIGSYADRAKTLAKQMKHMCSGCAINQTHREFCNVGMINKLQCDLETLFENLNDKKYFCDHTETSESKKLIFNQFLDEITICQNLASFIINNASCRCTNGDNSHSPNCLVNAANQIWEKLDKVIKNITGVK